MGSLRTGALKSQPCAAQIASMIFIRHEASVDSRPPIPRAPLPRLLSGFGMSSVGSISSFVPRPAHDGHAPCGELNENVRGSSSSIVKPSYGQLYFSL